MGVQEVTSIKTSKYCVLFLITMTLLFLTRNCYDVTIFVLHCYFWFNIFPKHANAAKESTLRLPLNINQGIINMCREEFSLSQVKLQHHDSGDFIRSPVSWILECSTASPLMNIFKAIYACICLVYTFTLTLTERFILLLTVPG